MSATITDVRAQPRASLLGQVLVAALARHLHVRRNHRSAGMLLAQWLDREFVQEVIASSAVETRSSVRRCRIEPRRGQGSSTLTTVAEQRMNGTAGGTGGTRWRLSKNRRTGLNELAKIGQIYPPASRCGALATDAQPLNEVPLPCRHRCAPPQGRRKPNCFWLGPVVTRSAPSRFRGPLCKIF